MTLQDRLDSAEYHSLGHLVSGWDYEPVTVVTRDARIYGDGSPWWGPGRIEALTVEQCRVLLERLTINRLWLRSAYLSTVRDVLCESLLIGEATERLEWPSAITLSGVHVRGGSFKVAAANVCWTGGSVEYTTGTMEIGSGQDEGAIVFVGTRFEHGGRKLTIRGPSPVTLVGCHFTGTDVEFAPDAHPDSKLDGCSHTSSTVVDRRPQPKTWWRIW